MLVIKVYLEWFVRLEVCEDEFRGNFPNALTSVHIKRGESLIFFSTMCKDAADASPQADVHSCSHVLIAF